MPSAALMPPSPSRSSRRRAPANAAVDRQVARRASRAAATPEPRGEGSERSVSIDAYQQAMSALVRAPIDTDRSLPSPRGPLGVGVEQIGVAAHQGGPAPAAAVVADGGHRTPAGIEARAATRSWCAARSTA